MLYGILLASPKYASVLLGREPVQEYTGGGGTYAVVGQVNVIYGAGAAPQTPLDVHGVTHALYVCPYTEENEYDVERWLLMAKSPAVPGHAKPVVVSLTPIS